MQLTPHIDNEECLVRIIKIPSHWDRKRKRLKTAAFKPKPGRSAISVIRQRMGDDFCKSKAMSAPQYFGLGVLRAAEVRRAECDLFDRPEDYVGHAEIEFGFVNPIADTPESLEVVERLNDICRDLVKVTQVFEDSRPTEPGWREGDLCP